jgi:hypothetical protein
MKHIIIIFIAGVLTIFNTLWAQTERRNVDAFSAISMGVAGDCYITQGNSVNLEVEGDADDLDDLITEVRNKTLYIKYRRGGWNIRRNRVTIHLITPELSEISLSGSGKVISRNRLNSDHLEIKVSGSGKMTLEVSADDLEASISGSGNMEVSGTADQVELTISGSGNLEAEELRVDRYDVRISGSGRSRIYVGDELNAKISGSGSVYYTGDPDKVISNVSGSGRVKEL